MHLKTSKNDTFLYITTDYFAIIIYYLKIINFYITKSDSVVTI